MRSFVVLVSLICILLPACDDDAKRGEVILQYEDTLHTGRNLVLNYKQRQSLFRDTAVIRLRTLFNNESVRICAGNNCEEYDSVTSNRSIAYAADMAIPRKGAKELRITFRGLVYYIPIKKDYLFIDLNIDESNILTVTYSNSILVLS